MLLSQTTICIAIVSIVKKQDEIQMKLSHYEFAIESDLT
jgi:uncharacterized membrane protein